MKVSFIKLLVIPKLEKWMPPVRYVMNFTALAQNWYLHMKKFYQDIQPRRKNKLFIFSYKMMQWRGQSSPMWKIMGGTGVESLDLQSQYCGLTKHVKNFTAHGFKVLGKGLPVIYII